MKMTKVMLLSAALVAVPMLVGCGGGGGSSEPTAVAKVEMNGQTALHLKVGDSWPVVTWSSENMDPKTSMNGGSNFGGTASPANDYCNVSGFEYIPEFGTMLAGAKNTGARNKTGSIITPEMAGCSRTQYVYGYDTHGKQSNVATATVYIDPLPVLPAQGVVLIEDKALCGPKPAICMGGSIFHTSTGNSSESGYKFLCARNDSSTQTTYAWCSPT